MQDCDNLVQSRERDEAYHLKSVQHSLGAATAELGSKIQAMSRGWLEFDWQQVEAKLRLVQLSQNNSRSLGVRV